MIMLAVCDSNSIFYVISWVYEKSHAIPPAETCGWFLCSLAAQLDTYTFVVVSSDDDSGKEEEDVSGKLSTTICWC